VAGFILECLAGFVGIRTGDGHDGIWCTYFAAFP